MVEIVNLRLVRKQRARAAAEKQSADNRVRFGTSKQERDARRAEREATARRHEGHRRENGGDGSK
jgi:hypothetical protein